METNNKITDELIAKYISGKTNEEEDNLIHEYLAHHPEYANDLLDVATALRHQHQQETKHIQLRPRRIFIAAAAASIVILIGIGLLVLKPFAKNEPEQPILAETSVDTPSQNDNASMMAALTVSEDNGDAPLLKDAVFITDSILKTCNPENGFKLKWTCNAPSLKLEISTDGEVWQTLNNNISNLNSLTINSYQLKGYKAYNPQCFHWRMTAKYKDGNLVRGGTVNFENN